MKLGVDVFLERCVVSFKEKRVGLIANQASVNRDLVPTLDLFDQHPNIQLTALFGPEHGARGDAERHSFNLADIKKGNLRNRYNLICFIDRRKWRGLDYSEHATKSGSTKEWK